MSTQHPNVMRILSRLTPGMIIWGSIVVLMLSPLRLSHSRTAAIDVGTDGGVLTIIGMEAGEGVSVRGPGAVEGRLMALSADVSGDGRADLIVGVPFSDGPGESRPEAGAVYIILSENRLSLARTQDLNAARPDVIIYGAWPEDHLGASLAAGDVNGDQVADLVVGAPLADGPNHTRPDVGEVYVFFGGPTLGARPLRDVNPEAPLGPGPDVRIIGWGGPAKDGAATASDQAGTALAVGDVNGDSTSDVVIGAPGVKGPDGKRVSSGLAATVAAPGGAVYVVYGSRDLASGTVRDFGVGTPVSSSPMNVDLIIYGQTLAIQMNGVQIAKVGEQLGRAVTIGDLNGDRIGDILAGAPYFTAKSEIGQGAVYAFFGSRTPLAVVRDTSAKQPPQGAGPDVVFQGINPGELLGSVLGAGDVSGDGVDDLLIGIPLANGPTRDRTATGAVLIVLGSRDLRVGKRDLEKQPAEIRLIGAQRNDGLGFALATEDTNGDGVKDLIVSAPAADGPGDMRSGAGEIYIILGGRLAPGTTLDLAQTPADVTFYGAAKGDQIGFSLALAAVDADRRADIIVTSPFADGSPDVCRPKAGVTYILLSR